MFEEPANGVFSEDELLLDESTIEEYLIYEEEHLENVPTTEHQFDQQSEDQQSEELMEEPVENGGHISIQMVSKLFEIFFFY